MELNKLILAVLSLVLLVGCGNAPTQEELDNANANADALYSLQEDYNELRQAYQVALSEGTLDEAALNDMTNQMVAMGFKLTDLYTQVSKPPEGEDTNWLEIGLAVFGSLTGVRVMRGGASKGLLAGVSGLGNGAK